MITRMISRMIRHGQVASITLLALALQACSSTNLHGENRKSLEAGMVFVSEVKVGPATRELESIVVRTSGAAGEYGLARFHAAVLLADVHMEAALRDPFMYEPDSMTREAKGKSAGLSNLVAASYYAGFAQDWVGAANRAAKSGKASEQVPAELAQSSIRDLAKRLDLAQLITYTRLGFQNEVADLFAGAPELLDLESCEKALEDSGVPASLRPWVYWSAFEFQKSRDEPRAYRLGIRAREAGREPGSTFGESRDQQIVDWILEESKYQYVSSAGISFDPGTDFCTQTGEPNHEFRAQLKEGN